MGSRLVVVESPAKARTIGRFLGGGYVVRASLGHIRDLPENDFGVETDNGFKPKYVLIPTKKKVVRTLAAAAKDADAVYIATDMDREGEAIAWHIKEVLGLSDEVCRRVVFSEITPRAIKRAFASPSQIDMRKVLAQQARRILDRIVGYKLSPLLWERFSPGLSAGRVQSVALRLVVEREREIREFRPRRFWTLTVEVEAGEVRFEMDVVDGEEKRRFWKKKEAEEVAGLLKERLAEVVDYKKWRQGQRPFPPHITSTLQQEMASLHRMSPRETMRHAQALYEGVDVGERGRRGVITYHRTDSVRVAGVAVRAVRKFIPEVFGKEYLPQKARRFRVSRYAQAAHEAIRPTMVDLTPEEAFGYLNKQQALLYEAVWRRFVASQMADALYDVTEAAARCGDVELYALRRRMVFDGFLRVYGRALPSHDALLPQLKKGQKLRVVSVRMDEHETQPPSRYSEATLVRKLEQEGIGRPSTYATIIHTLYRRRYVVKRGGRLYPTELGEHVAKLLVERFPRVMDVGFTRWVEGELDRVEEGEKEWRGVLEEFWAAFSRELEEARETLSDGGRVCPKCGKPLILKKKGGGVFWGCSGYPSCRYRESAAPKPQPTDLKCEKCGAPMVIRYGRYGPFLACSAFPKCRNAKSLNHLNERKESIDGDSDS